MVRASDHSAVSLKIEDLIVLNKLQPKDDLLFLYAASPGIDKFDVFLPFLCAGRENNELAAHISAGYAEKGIEEKFQKLQLPKEKFGVYFGCYDAERIKEALDELCEQIRKNQSTLRLVVDYGNALKLNPAWTIKIEKKIHEEKRKNLFSYVISAFDVSSLDPKTFSVLLKFHEKILVQTENKSLMISYNDNRKLGDRGSSLKIIPKETLEKVVKDNLRLLILGILNKNEMTGYDVIKLFHKKFRLRVSPGTMYPLLFSIKKEGLIEIKTDENDLKRKVYLLTGEGRKAAENELTSFLAAREYLSDLM